MDRLHSIFYMGLDGSERAHGGKGGKEQMANGT